MADVPYQQKPQVDQLQAERENAVAYGNDNRVEQIDRQLTDLGVKAKAAEERKAASDDSVAARRTPPKGRTARGPAEKTMDGA